MKPVKHKKVPAKQSNIKIDSKKTYFIESIILLLITFIAYSPVLKAGFVNWDDQQYVYENVLITSFSHLKELLSTTVQGNFHPLTMFSLAVNYSMSKYDAFQRFDDLGHRRVVYPPNKQPLPEKMANAHPNASSWAIQLFSLRQFW